MPVDIAALRTELDTDPQGLGYAPLIARGSDADIAELLNQRRAGAAYVVFDDTVNLKDVIEAVAPADYVALTAVQIARLQLLFTGGSADCSRVNTRQILNDLFGGASQPTRNAIAAVISRQGSRAEKLFGVRTRIHHLQVAAAFGRGNA